MLVFCATDALRRYCCVRYIIHNRNGWGWSGSHGVLETRGALGNAKSRGTRGPEDAESWEQGTLGIHGVLKSTDPWRQGARETRSSKEPWKQGASRNPRSPRKRGTLGTQGFLGPRSPREQGILGNKASDAGANALLREVAQRVRIGRQQQNDTSAERMAAGRHEEDGIELAGRR